ncbi:DUF3450 family protein [Vibrio sp. V27_P1S3P104]|nr:DUF3450 family protein [Vibrio sp. V28_P6S34P95]NAX04666.1 DUF3450 family protein [Vibrio sp. V30_P3S12P165]NAX33088.1 DUF3450 family protein [Vibrio sp. V29_P1S30P107]NAX37453.1 DUF3450 family protein [Vibrio sp. V27_P1S3P104]NAX41436.1 DUF3450 family protein [Vibrio sp. V26_P1S5P106]
MMNLIKSSLILLSAVSVLPSYASTLDDAKAIQNRTNNHSAVSQKKIDKSSAETLALQAEIERLNEEVNNLTIYRDHLSALVVSQEVEMSNLEEQMTEIHQTRQGIVPLMYRMIDGLEKIITEDKPIRLAARQERLARLQLLMSRADVSDAEKYRRILEAYQIEMDYGSKLGVYQGTIDLSDQDRIEADILYLGRVSLVARNLNGTRYWSWDQHSKHWQPLPSGIKGDIDTAYQLAYQQIAPTLLNLPVSLTVAEATQ